MATSDLVKACREADGIIVIGTRITEEVLRECPQLRVVSVCGVGYEVVDVNACTQRRIVVTNTPGVLSDTTADLAFGLLATVARRIVESDRYIRQGRWHAWRYGEFLGADIHHKTLGIYGFGRIGQALARRGHGFSMRIIYHDLHRLSRTAEQHLAAEYVDQETLLRESDFVSLHVALLPETRRLIGRKELNLMKPSAFLINTSRGPVVDEEALVEALNSKSIAGAGLDVFQREPFVHPAFATMDNVVLTTHMGSASAYLRLSSLTVTPASPSFKTAIICSSVNRLLFIVSSPPGFYIPENSHLNWSSFRGAPQPAPAEIALTTAIDGINSNTIADTEPCNIGAYLNHLARELMAENQGGGPAGPRMWCGGHIQRAIKVLVEIGVAEAGGLYLDTHITMRHAGFRKILISKPSCSVIHECFQSSLQRLSSPWVVFLSGLDAKYSRLIAVLRRSTPRAPKSSGRPHPPTATALDKGADLVQCD